MFLTHNKLLIKFFEWLYFPKEVYDEHGNYYQYKIVKIQRLNVFLVDKYLGVYPRSCGRYTISPIWDLKRVEVLFKRIF